MYFIQLNLKKGDIAYCYPASVTNPGLQHEKVALKVRCIRDYSDSIRPGGLRLDHSTLVNNWVQYVEVLEGQMNTAHLVANDWRIVVEPETTEIKIISMSEGFAFYVGAQRAHIGSFPSISDLRAYWHEFRLELAQGPEAISRLIFGN